MTVPKQIIYPIRYIRPFFDANPSHEDRFREEFRSFLDDDVHVTALGRARAGLYLLAKMARRGDCNHVVMLPYTIPDVVNMIRFAGCQPVFVDTLPSSTNIDIDHLVTLLDNPVCCVLLTHYHVNQDRLEDVRDLCRRRDILLFDDCAIALGGEQGGAPLGTCADASVFSMSGFKTLNYIWGGAVTTTNPELGEVLNDEVSSFPRLRAEHYRRHMLAVVKYDVATRDPLFSRVIMPLFQRKVRESDNNSDPITFTRIESTSIDDTIRSRPSLGALRELSRKFSTVKANLAHRRRIAAIYDEWVGEKMISAETSAATRSGSCFINYPIVVEPSKRDWIYRELIKSGFHVGLSSYPNVHETPTFSDTPGRSENISRMVRSAITLPTHPKVTPDYAADLGEALGKLVKH
ncbi:DegT/DnrJ/EryC1/StrS aminotransferase family protein [Pseudorhizobium endolithicum]|uniref:DegT/DnrJ/EryC1/StrS aminotransferase family protein n=1 Tax=Pseudorhizobium endolithicum TaxID=1191678 RepID=A0ABM8PIL7_9HYPH|nr:DegT/DnrJ/EryC1/StrS family aminotransferase [Pseudorhizobium endolithicum]CAD6436619.1 DegT/DnrJ/EryC1/StrS aminotransferase family protein [Rhizobium sp. Q54]CAD7032211.1 DegT/DnrJ/EryC1/StrS aminotransferase family protein [Pseudorhizobium endolithicum]